MEVYVLVYDSFIFEIEETKKEFVKHWGENTIMPAVDETNIDWNVVKKEGRVINDVDFWEVQLSIGIQSLQKKVSD